MVVVADFLKTHPLNFVLYYQNYSNLNTIYLDEGYSPLPLFLEIYNLNNKDIQLSAPSASNAGNRAEDCHFYLRIPQGILKIDNPESILSDDNWQVKYVPAIRSNTPPSSSTTSQENNPPGAVRGFDSLYFVRQTAQTIARKKLDDPDDPDNRIILTLNKIQAAPGARSRASSIRLNYGGLTAYKIADNPPINLLNQGYDYDLFVIKRLGKKYIPLHAGFVGSNTILNDGLTANQLKLQITNIQKSTAPRPNLPINSNSQCVISFESGDLDQEWALAELDQVQGIQITATDQENWDVEKQDSPPQWTLRPKMNANGTPKKAFLNQGEVIELNINNITTAHPSGKAKLILRYQDISDYWDGELTCIIEKTPLMFRAPLRAAANNDILTAVRIKTSFDDNGKSGVKHVGLAVDTGDVGIGTTDPKGKLHVVGDITLGNDLNNQKFIMHSRSGSSSGDFLIITPDNSDGDWQWYESGIILRRNGDVGIGTQNPTEQLEVNGNIKTNNAYIGSTHSGFAGFSHKDKGETSGGYALLQNSSGRTILNAASGQSIAFKINNSEKMTLDSSGKLGFGTTSPEEKLHIKDGSLRIDNGQIKSWGTITFQPNTDQSAGEDLIKFLNKDANSVAIIKDDGKVGIGTTDPKGELHLVGNLTLGNDANNQKFIMHPRSGSSNGDWLQITSDKSNGDWDWDQGITLKRGGNVGIGNTSPRDKLDVNGWISSSKNGFCLYENNSSSSRYWVIYPQWNDSGDPDLMFNYSAKTHHSGWVAGWLEPEGDGWRCPSDQRLKQDMEPISNILEKVMELQPKSYRWIESEPDSRKSWGFIAQEVESVFPDRVSNKRDLKGLNYSDFGVLAIAAIQEQQKLIDALQEEVAQLKQ